MQSEAAEGVLQYDDITTTLVIDLLMGFKRLKLSKIELPTLHGESTLIDILKNIQTDSDTRLALGHMLSMDWTKEITVNMGKTEMGELKAHLMKYLKGLTAEGGFKLYPESRYSMEGFQGAKKLQQGEQF